MYSAALDPDTALHNTRRKVGYQIAAVLKDNLQKSFFRARVLDVGCSYGDVTRVLSRFCKSVSGIDTDAAAIMYAKRNNSASNIKYIVRDGTHSNFPPGSFDIVICNQVYQYMHAPQSLMDEIYKLLVPGGICYFGAPLRLNRIVARDENSVMLLSYARLRRLCRKFTVIPYTAKVLTDPGKYKFYKLRNVTMMTSFIPKTIWHILEPFMPSVVWLLEKPARTKLRLLQE